MKKNFKAGFVAIIGKPNVGKSTFLNEILQEKISIISPKPQTTRHQIKGIYNDAQRQIVFLDTPGFLKARYELHNKMLEYIEKARSDSDLIIFITDANKFPTDYDREILQSLKKKKTPKIAILNKIDLIDEKEQNEKIHKLEDFAFNEIIKLSLIQENDFNFLISKIDEFLPYSPPLYAPDEISDLSLRFFVQEIILEQIFLNLKEEIPYSTAARVENYQDLQNKVKIYAVIWLERKSQKTIIIGKNGKMIKKIRTAAEKEIHKIVQKRVYLDLWIKIKPNWRKKKNALKEFGYR